MSQDGTAVQAIAELAQKAVTEFVEIDGVPMSAVSFYDHTPKLHEPDPLQVHTLKGLVDYLETNRDQLEADKVVVHVTSPTKVEVVSGLQGKRNQRFIYARAVAEAVEVAGPSWMDPEEMIVQLNTLCDREQGDVEGIVAIVGNISSENSVKKEDDGFTQKVTVKGGVTIVGEQRVENPVQLAPYRSFREIAQVASPFMLRFRGGGDTGISCRLFEADAGTWRLKAVERLLDWLVAAVPEGFEVIG